MNNRKETFWSLLNRSKIVIPQIQRDYAYGRQTEKAKNVREDILGSLKTTLSIPDNKFSSDLSLVLDFVYGSISKDKSMTPLDGQQRLTTLFLLHLYAAIKEKVDSGELNKFCYETRHSANEFCKSLINDFIYDLSATDTLESQIKNQAKYLNTYDDDPTIQSMLVVLDDIHKNFFSTENLWDKLTNQERVYFYYLDLDRFGLSDDLYIKMNSRGKGLTKYEIFKSSLEKFLETNHKTYKEDVSRKLDTDWTNMLWNEECNVDNGFLNLFQNIFKINYYQNNSTPKEIPEAEKCFKEMLSNESDLIFFIKVLDTFSNLSKNNPSGISDYYKKYFYVSENASGEASLIRFFWPSKENLFSRATTQSLTWAEIIIFYALIISLQNEIDEKILFLRFRKLRNLVVNSNFELRPENIHKMLNASQELILNGILPSETFNQNQIQEENEKLKLNDFDNKLLVYENHKILRGSLGLFIKQSNEIGSLLNSLMKFSLLFDNNYESNTPILRQAILSVGDYSQQDTDQRKRFLIHNKDAWRYFFTINQRRKEQENIILLINKIPISGDMIVDLTSIRNNYISSGEKDWKYYFIKYDEKTHHPGTQGYYYWKDRNKAPLEVIMLNSSYESPSNLEWNIFNWILYWQHTEETTLDDHGASKLILFKAGLSMNAIQSGYIIEATNENNPNFEKLKAENIILENGRYEVNSNDDFIDKGNELISMINKYNEGNTIA